MIKETLESRLRADRPMTSVTVRMPQDVVESMKRIAPLKGFSGYQALLKWYLGEGLRKDEAEYGDLSLPVDVLIDALQRNGLDSRTVNAVRNELQGMVFSISLRAKRMEAVHVRTASDTEDAIRGLADIPAGDTLDAESATTQIQLRRAAATKAAGPSKGSKRQS